MKEHWPRKRSRCCNSAKGLSLPVGSLAMRFNNKGAWHMQHGDCKQAIVFLCRALKLVEQDSRSHIDKNGTCIRSQCNCEQCKLETCMMNDVTIPRGCPLLSQPNLREESFQMGCTYAPGSISLDTTDCTGPNKGFLYSRPLVASSISIRQNHHMGVTLSLMVLFNLALAYQLDGTLSKSRQLYELCYQIQMRAHHRHCLWFTMCISNNLSEIHRNQGSIQYASCLQHLLSTMMYIVDFHLTVSHDDSTGLLPNSIQRQSDTIFHKHMMQTAMDGFFRNSSQMILRTRVASAA